MTRGIIIVDDDRSFVDAAAIFLEDHGYRVTKAYTARDGISALMRQHIDLAVVDVNLPDQEGTSVANAVRQWQPSVPIVLISSDDSTENTRRCQAEADGHLFLAKPLIPKNLLDTISRALGERAGRECEPVPDGHK